MLNVIQITDCHIQATPNAELRGVNVDLSLAAVLAHITERHAAHELILATGDLIHDDPAAYPRFQAMLEPMHTPVYCLPGNHDIPAELAAQYHQGRVKQTRYVQHGGWQFILLDTSIAGSPNGRLAQTELDFLDQTLTQESARPALICLHHHPVPIDCAWLDTQMISNRDALFEILDRHLQVRALIWGHIHQPYAGQRGHFGLYGTPATSCQFTPDSDQPSIEHSALPGYRWFHLYPDGQLETGIERVPYASNTGLEHG